MLNALVATQSCCPCSGPSLTGLLLLTLSRLQTWLVHTSQEVPPKVLVFLLELPSLTSSLKTCAPLPRPLSIQLGHGSLLRAPSSLSVSQVWGLPFTVLLAWRMMSQYLSFKARYSWSQPTAHLSVSSPTENQTPLFPPPCQARLCSQQPEPSPGPLPSTSILPQPAAPGASSQMLPAVGGLPTLPPPRTVTLARLADSISRPVPSS